MTSRRPRHAPEPPMSDAQHAAISHELVRLTLSGRPERPKLALDPLARIQLTTHRHLEGSL